MAECKLCHRDRELANSHIIPRFVIRWMKKSGPTPFLRKFTDPNTRIQDIHEKMLCGDCEEIFSEWESKFASQTFYPHVRDQSDQFEYGEWMYRFILSVSWRLLVSEMAVWHESDHPKIDIAEERVETWRPILLGEKPLTEDPSTHHVIFVEEIDVAISDPEAPDNYEIYMQRNIDGTSVFGDDDIHVFFKFPKIVFFSTIYPPDPGGLTNTQVAEEGVIEPPQKVGGIWGDFLHNRVEVAGQASMSEHEREKVEERILKDPEQFLESDFLDAHHAEMRRKWAEHDLRDHLNENECSVCFTNHRVIESIPKEPVTETYVRQLGQGFPFADATFPREEEVEGIPTHITDVLVISTESTTQILQFYMGYGWIVGEEVEHPDGVEPEEIGRTAWEQYSEDFHRQMRVRYGKDSS